MISDGKTPRTSSMCPSAFQLRSAALAEAACHPHVQLAVYIPSSARAVVSSCSVVFMAMVMSSGVSFVRVRISVLSRSLTLTPAPDRCSSRCRPRDTCRGTCNRKRFCR